MNKFIFIVMFIYSPYVLAETNGSLKEFITETKLGTDNAACDQTALIDKKLFCVKKSRITLNSCGKRSDWPCLDIDGCLVIDKYVLND